MALASRGGRNSHGHVTVRHRGGGHKRKYRRIDFKRDKVGIPGRVAALEYDPNRSARIALIHYKDGEKRYILAPDGLAVGQEIQAGPGSDVRPGNALPLAQVPLGTTVHNVELRPGRGGQLARSAGAAVQLMAREGSFATLRLPSGETRLVESLSVAPTSVDTLINATGLSVSTIQMLLLELDLAGRIEWSSGQLVALKS